MKRDPPGTRVESSARMLFCPEKVVPGPKKGTWSQESLQIPGALTRFVHFSHGRNTKIKILEWAELCLENDLRSEKGKGQNRSFFSPVPTGRAEQHVFQQLETKIQ